MDARYTEVNTYAEQTTGRYLPKTPRFKMSLSPDLHTHLANGAMLRLGVDFTHTAEIFNDVQNTWVLRRPKEDVVDLFAAIVSADGKASLTVGGTNLTDRRFITTGISDDTRGVIYGDYSPPREWYATLGIKIDRRPGALLSTPAPARGSCLMAAHIHPDFLAFKP